MLINRNAAILPTSKNNNAIPQVEKKLDGENKTSQHVPKLVQIQFAQFLNTLLEYASELTYFSINAFQTSSLRRVQINTLQRYTEFCVPRACAFYYNLDTEFENFVQKMRLLCSLAKRTFLDMRVARIHYNKGRMRSLPITRRSIEILKCNISRLRDLKEIHQEIGHDLLLPNDQLYLALDLLVTDFELLNCELDAQVKFADAMVLQTIIKDIFLQYRIALTWIYPAVKQAAYRPGDPTRQQEVKKCDQPIAHQQIHNFCGKPKKLTKQFSLNQAHLFDQITSRSRNVNQNFTAEISDEYSEKNSMDICGINAAKDDFTRYLSEKKLQHLGTRNLHKSNSMKNLHTFLHFNQFMENFRENILGKSP